MTAQHRSSAGAGGEDPVTALLGQLLRHPEPPRELAVERALLRLQAARPDAAYLLMHRLLVLETALQQLQQSAPTPSPSQSTAPPAAPARSFLRDAAVVAAGVVAGQALWQGLSPGDDNAVGEGLGLDLWL